MHHKFPTPLASVLLALTLTSSTALANFEEASAHIDLDGSMLGYMNFEGDGLEIGTALNEIYQQILASTPQMPPIPVDFNLLIENLGFGSLKAIAMSSKDVEPGLCHNRSITLLNGAPQGLFRIYNTEPLTFTAADKAPADATGAITASVNIGALRDTSTQVMQQIMGPMGAGLIQQQLTQVIPGSDISYNEAIDLLSGKWDAFWLQSYGEDFQQEFKFWVSIEDGGSALARLQSIAENLGAVFIEDDNTLKANLSAVLGEEAPFGLYLEAPKQSGELIIYSHSDWTPNSDAPRLNESQAFKNFANRLPRKAMAFNYSKGADLAPITASLSALPQAAQYIEAAQSALNLFIGDFLKPSMAVTYMDGENMVSDQYASFSAKQVIMTFPTIAAGGIGAAMAIPAFNKARTPSQEKAVTNNLRQIAAAADQYFLEEGKTSVRIENLVGPNKYIRELNPVAGESYEGMIIEAGTDISVTLGNGEVITCKF